MKKLTAFIFALGLLFGFGELALGQITISKEFSEFGFTNGQQLPSGNLDGSISFATEKNEGSSATAYFTDGTAIRFYPGGGLGGSIVITPIPGVKITNVKLISNQTQPVIYYVDDLERTGEGTEMEANETYDITEDIFESLELINVNENTSGPANQLRLTGVEVTYEITTSDPLITSSVTELADFEYIEGEGSSNSKNFTLSGVNLAGNENVTINFRSGNESPFELSEDDDTFSNAITLNNYNGSDIEVYVRLKNGLLENESLQDIIDIEGYDNSLEIGLSGKVLPAIVRHEGTFELLTSEVRLTEGYYVIANETSEFLMTNDVSGGFFASAALGLDINENVEKPDVNHVWYIKPDGAGFSIYNEETERYVAWSSGNSAKADDEVTDNARWIFTYEDGKFTVNNVSDLTRQLSYNATTPRFAAYGNAKQQELQLYKLATEEETLVIKLTGNAGFRMLSSPVAATYSDFLEPIWTQGATSGADVPNGAPNVFTWDETDDNEETNWLGVTDLETTTTAGKGFLVYVYEDDNYTEEGGTDWPKTLSISGTENAADVPVNLNSNAGGFTLLGNPFASSIDFNTIDNENLTGAVYIWDPNDESGEGGKDGNNPGGSWKTYAVGGAGDITGGLIAPFQGFFVQTDDGITGTPSVTFTEAAKTGGAPFLGKAIAQDKAVARLELRGNGLANSMWLQFSKRGALGTSVKGDALELEALSSHYARLATQKGATLLDIAHLPFADEEYSIPLDVSATKGGRYSLSATRFEMPANQKLYFTDTQTGSKTLITPDFAIDIDIPAAKIQSVPPLQKLVSAPIAAKSTGSSRYAITVTPNLSVHTEPNTGVPHAFALAQNYPNPFNPSTVIGYQIPHNGHVRLEVFDLLGQKVATLVDGVVTAGAHQVTFDSNGLSSGVYIYRLSAGNQVFTKKLTLIK